MNKVVIGGLTVVALVAVAGGGYWLGQRNVAAGAPNAAVAAAPAPVGGGVSVEASKVARVALPQGITAVGSLRSDESVTLRPEVAGRISAIQFREGERVTKGTPLVRLDTAVAEAEAQQARANLTLAQQKHTRALDLEKKGFISSQAKDEAENNLRVAEASLALSEAKLAKLTIMAPFTGIIGLRSVSVGDYVKEGADMVNLEAVDPLKVDFRVPEIYLTQLGVGQSLQLTLDAMPGKTYEGKVFAINPLLDAAGRSVVIRAQVKNQDAALRPGMFTRVRLLTRDLQETLVVPEQAIVPQGEEWFVYRVVDGKAQRAKVDIGQRRDGKAEIIKGLQDGDTVVTAGQLKLREGVPVQIAAAPTAAPAPAPPKADAAAPALPKS
ncbi:MAG TPA: efflux RND transporter periplasmic adaptor subunit [Casimicrobiaceae bacterium]|jgi:membrane fusion protein (multidrug efflux system)